MAHARATALALLFALAAPACRATPGATRLDESAVARSIDPANAVLPAAELEVQPLELEGVRGGRIVFSVEASVEEVVETLLDFEHADGHRAWAVHHEPLSRTGQQATARWKFEGRGGLNPTVELQFDVAREGREAVVTYHLLKPAFGVAAFFGEYRVHPSTRARPTLLEETVFIDSGVTFANATQQEIAAGLREDARLLREWIRARGADGSGG
jgi:hypothetical protein